MLIDFNDVTFWKILKYRNGKRPVATRDGTQEEEGHEERRVQGFSGW